MRMNIEIDEKLLREAMRSCRELTDGQPVEAALRLLGHFRRRRRAK